MMACMQQQTVSGYSFEAYTQTKSLLWEKPSQNIQ